MRIKPLLPIILMFLLTACSDPSLKTASESDYKESLKKIFDAQPSEEKRLEIAQGVLFVITDGQEKLKNENSGIAYNAFHALQTMGQSGRLMPLDGKNAQEIIAAGFEARKTWAMSNLPKRIEQQKKAVADLEEKKLQAERFEQTRKSASVSNIRMESTEMLAHGTNKPMGFVQEFIISVDATNNGSVDIYAYDLDVKINGPDANKNPILYGTLTVKFPEGVKPGATQPGTITYSVGGRRLPYGPNYSLVASLQSVQFNKQSHMGFNSISKFDQSDINELEKYKKQLAESEAEIAGYR